MSNITVHEAHQRQGLFRKLLNRLQLLADIERRVLRVESILNEGVREDVARRGYVVSASDPATYYRLPMALEKLETGPLPIPEFRTIW
jgi:hypothetical protein